MPLLALLGGSLLAERLLVDWLHAWLAVGHDGEVGHSRSVSHECCRLTRKALSRAVAMLQMFWAVHLVSAFSLRCRWC